MQPGTTSSAAPHSLPPHVHLHRPSHLTAHSPLAHLRVTQLTISIIHCDHTLVRRHRCAPP